MDIHHPGERVSSERHDRKLGQSPEENFIQPFKRNGSLSQIEGYSDPEHGQTKKQSHPLGEKAAESLRTEKRHGAACDHPERE